MNQSRRVFLKAGLGGVGLLAAEQLLAANEDKPKKRIPVGLQLYSVRQDCAKDLPGVLKAVAEMGYEGVEFAGYYDRKAEEMRELLDANKLKCCGTHTALDTLVGDALARTVEYNKVIGNKYLVVPSLPRERMASIAALRETAKLLTDIAEKVKPQGMRVGYHAHAGDFKKVEGQIPWEVLFDAAGPDVIMQLDVGNCLAGGGDPLATLAKYPGRSVTIHLKEHGGKPGAVIGEGEVKWKDVFEFCEARGGTEWYIVEQESYATTPLESVKACLRNVRRLQKRA
ncbi:MAG TPA: sugar phosphate isomerase/epimerase [Phycisphaerae bacterium]|nr:sugar phosphate isomerase/epimerase [Phycisphaerae bacterium]